MELAEIKSPADIKSLPVDRLPELCSRLRETLLLKLSRNGGHIGPNLGVVEATVALHYVFDSPTDKIVWDVSHQSYVHKMLTGRMNAFLNPEDYDCVTGYTNVQESAHDFFTVGHTSTSVSLACGLAKARDLRGESGDVIAFIGDGSLSGGEALEGLDFADELHSGLIVVVNDNQMSIAENHGGIYDNLRLLRQSDGTAECNIFRSLGFDYLYVGEGNDTTALVNAFRRVKGSSRPVVVHINTMKGHGFAPAEADRESFHYGSPFDLATGKPLHSSTAENYAGITADMLLDLMAENPSVAVITAGTPTVAGFTPDKRHRAGSQFIDTGIAEENAVALASGMARGGARPFFGVYSTFIQRAYDQVSQDLCINGNPAVIGVFGAGAASMNDITHLCWFDIPLLSNIPGFTYLAPTCRQEYTAMLRWAMTAATSPVGIRVPGLLTEAAIGRTFPDDYSGPARYEVLRQGREVAVIAVGDMLHTALHAADIAREHGREITVINPRYLDRLDQPLLHGLMADHSLVITLEDGCIAGGFGEKIASFFGTTSMRVDVRGLPKEFRDRYNPAALYAECRMTPDIIAADIIGSQIGE